MDPTAICAIPEAGRCRALILASAAAVLAGCEGDRGPAGPPGPPGGGGTTPTEVARGEAAPRVIVVIEELSGSTGAAGAFRVGDVLSVCFRLKKEDGSTWQLAEMVSGEALVSGPTFNYQRVLPLASDLVAASVSNGDDSYTYIFDPLPAVYAPPYNDSPSFGAVHGELTGQPLLDGTYTLGLSFAWDYTVEGVGYLQVGEASFDFLLGTGAGGLVPREVTRLDNCNQCHVELRAHDGRYRNLVLCLLCHTPGAEDANDPGVAGGTPGVAVDSRVLFHRLHSGRSLPSVQGVTTNPDGSRNYASTPVSLLFARSNGSVRDYSKVAWPVMPNREQPMPRDVGYSALPPPAQAAEDLILSGPATCFVCHGDPDGTGPLVMPAQGDLIEAQLSRKACGACHDDVNFDTVYTANLAPMPPQPDDTQCIFCHAPAFDHLHPLKNTALNPGIHVDFASISEAGTNDGDGTFDPGEKTQVELSIQTDSGANIGNAQIESIHAVLSGPTASPQVLLDLPVPKASLVAPQPFVLNLPELRQLELVGTSTSTGSEVFQTSATPIQDPSSTVVLVRTSTAGASFLSAAASRRQNFADVADPAPFQRDEHVVVDDGLATEEVLRIQFVDGNRLWFSAPNQPAYPAGFAFAHTSGATIHEVSLTPKTQGVDYSLNASTGEITELVEFGAGNDVLATYTTDFVVPADYPAPSNDSPDLDDSAGEWTGKSLADGTYGLSVRASRLLTINVLGEMTTYRASSAEIPQPLLFGSAVLPDPYTRISSAQNCAACHQDLTYHDGSYRGFATCILCHGSSGLEDLPRYVAANAPATPANTVAFRTMLHRIHRGSKLANPTYTVVGAGTAAYPDNFTNHTYERVLFPALPGDTRQCAKCHGDANIAALFPDDRGHPTEQISPVRNWKQSCSGCHDSAAALAHMDANTAPSGVESCSICHDLGEDEDVLLVHEAR